MLGGFVDILKSFAKKKNPRSLSELAQRSVDEKWSIWSLKGGLQTFPETLAESAKAAGVELFLETDCTGLEFVGEKGVLVKNNKEEFIASRVISALPAFQLARLVLESHQNLASLLQSIPAVTVAVVNMVSFISFFKFYLTDQLKILGMEWKTIRKGCFRSARAFV